MPNGRLRDDVASSEMTGSILTFTGETFRPPRLIPSLSLPGCRFSSYLSRVSSATFPHPQSVLQSVAFLPSLFSVNVCRRAPRLNDECFIRQPFFLFSQEDSRFPASFTLVFSARGYFYAGPGPCVLKASAPRLVMGIIFFLPFFPRFPALKYTFLQEPAAFCFVPPPDVPLLAWGFRLDIGAFSSLPPQQWWPP